MKCGKKWADGDVRGGSHLCGRHLHRSTKCLRRGVHACVEVRSVGAGRAQRSDIGRKSTAKASRGLLGNMQNAFCC